MAIMISYLIVIHYVIIESRIVFIVYTVGESLLPRI